MDNNRNFSAITACGECCVECQKKLDGICPGCIEADGFVPEWAGSGRCRVHTCTRNHNVTFCGLCEEFPCKNIKNIMPWKTDVVEQMKELSEKYRRG